MFQFATQPLSIPKIWRAGFSLYKNTFTQLWYLLFVFGIIFSGYTGAIGFLFVKQDMLKQLPILLIIAVGIATAIIFTFLYLLFVHRMYQLGAATNISCKNSCKIAAKKLGKYFLSIIYIVLIIFAIIAAFTVTALILTLPLLLLKLFIPAFATWLITTKTIIAAIVGTVLTIPLLCLCAIVFITPICTLPLILLENSGAWAAIKNSLRLIWGNYWRTFTAIFLPLQLIMLVPITLAIISGLHPHNTILTAVHYTVLIIVHTFLALPLYSSLLLVQFNDLKLRRDMVAVWVPKKAPSISDY